MSMSVVADRISGVPEHAKEMELDMRVRVDEFLGDPGRGTRHRDAELLAQFACERIRRRFTGFELAARKFPVTGVMLARWALGEQHAAIRMHDNGCSDADDPLPLRGQRVARRIDHACFFSARAPA